MASPFAIFRKHEKKLLAVAAIMAMIAFVAVGPGMSVFDMLGLFGVGRGGRHDVPVVAQTKWGQLTRLDVEQLKAEREKANLFIVQTMAAAGRMPMTDFFGEPTDDDIVFSELARHKAQEMGVQVSDDTIRYFIDQLTFNRLNTEQFEAIRRQLNISGSGLFDILRNELIISELLQVVVGGLGGTEGVGSMTPHELWENYQKLHTRISLDVAAVPVADFTDQVEAPSEDALTELFEKYKERLPAPASPEPGFKQPRRVQVEYAMANFDLIASRIEVSNDEVRKFYDDNKEALYRLPDEPAAGSDKAGATESKPSDGEKPAGAETPTPGEAQPTNDQDSAQPSETPADSQTDQPGATEGEKPASPDTDKPADAASSESNQPSGSDQTPERDAKDSTPANQPTDDIAASEAAQTDSPAPEQPDGSEAPSATKDAPAAEQQPAADKPDGAVEDSKPGAAPTEPRYKPFDEAAIQIHDQLQKQKAREEIERLLGDNSEVFKTLDTFGAKHSEWQENKKRSEENKDKAAEPPGPEPARPDFKTLAESHGLEYGMTPLVSAAEARELPGLGGAREGGFQGATFEELALANRSLFTPLRVKEIGENTYLFWVTEAQDEHVPTFEEARDQVLQAWKLSEARDLARQRADELATLAREGSKPLTEALAGQQGIVVTTTPPFSWMTRNVLSPLAFQQRIQRSEVPDVEYAGEEFMETAFALAEGAVGMAHNTPEDTYYVLRVAKREPADREQFYKEGIFSPTVYQQFVVSKQRTLIRQWFESLRTEYEVTGYQPSDEFLQASAGE